MPATAEPKPPAGRRPGRRWAVRRGVVAVAAVALVGGAGVATRALASSDPGGRYRTAVVSRGSVSEQVQLAGTVQRVHQKVASFAVAGTVASVDVALGAKVARGQVLARLDPAGLEDAVTQATAALARAEAAVESDEAGATAASAADGAAPVAGGAAPVDAGAAPVAYLMTYAATTAPSRGAAPSSVSAAEAAVTAARTTLGKDEAAAVSAQSDATALCEPVTAGPSTHPSPTSTSAPSSTPTSTASPTTTGGGGPSPTTSAGAVTACLDALRATSSAQATTLADEVALARAEQGFAASLTAWAGELATGSTSPARTPAPTTTSRAGGTRSAPLPRAGSGSGDSGQGGGQGGRSDGAGTAPSGPARVASDQAAAAQAEQQLQQAQSALAGATLRAPIAGTVGAISLVAGQPAGANGVTVVGSGAAEVTLDVSLTSISEVAVGQQADVTPQGGLTTTPGTVASIGLLPASSGGGSGGASSGASSSATPSYPVTVLLPAAGTAFSTGSRASVSVLVASAHAVLTVPVSAVTRTASGTTFVTVLDAAGAPQREVVRLGAVGASRVEVTSGLRLGERVVLADVEAPLPSSGAAGRGFGAGRAGAGAFGGSSFPGGAGGSRGGAGAAGGQSGAAKG